MRYVCEGDHDIDKTLRVEKDYAGPYYSAYCSECVGDCDGRPPYGQGKTEEEAKQDFIYENCGAVEECVACHEEDDIALMAAHPHDGYLCRHCKPSTRRRKKAQAERDAIMQFYVDAREEAQAIAAVLKTAREANAPEYVIGYLQGRLEMARYVGD